MGSMKGVYQMFDICENLRNGNCRAFPNERKSQEIMLLCRTLTGASAYKKRSKLLDLYQFIYMYLMH